MTETLHAAIPEDVQAAAHRVLEAACEANLSLTTAESCTGGLLASLLTDVEGCSHIFERGFVVYSPEAKCELLQIDRELLADCDAVSKKTAYEMARGALNASRADVALSITGYAGKGDEPGLIFFTCMRRGGVILEHESHFGDIGRGPIRIASLRVALDLLARAVS